ncbi:MAG: hypothetical protein EHM58_16390 [Ignavibacteriae bacterium]|nr:MAG: hypothetical protein EHM58_16390 [Ignavibacteriota bacterium]
MKYIILFVLFAVVFTSCTKKEVNKSNVTSENETKPSNKPAETIKEITIFKFNKSDVPEDIKYQGEIIDGAKWTDANGDNLLFITETKTKHYSEEEREEYIYAYAYTISDTSFTKLWNINDFVRSYCDVGVDYIPGSLEVLDLDKDGIAENAFIYKLEDRCDVSPLDIKLMMHSNAKKLVIRGNTVVYPGGGEKYGGEKKFDPAFDSSPEIFRDFASRKWDAFMKDYKGP